MIPPNETSAALRPLPVEALRLPEHVVELLHQLGIYRTGQLESLPRADLTSRFGPQLLERWDQATGRLAEPIRAHPLPLEFRAEWSLEHPTTRRETIEFVLEQLLGRLSRMLIRSGRGAVRLECRLDCESAPGVELLGGCPNSRAAKRGLSLSENSKSFLDGSLGCPPAQGVDLSVGLFQPNATPRHLFELVRMQLERVRLPAPVSAVRVEAAATAPFERQEEALFAGGWCGRRPRQLAGLIDRLTSRLGRRAVLRPRLASDAQPELAYRYDPLVEGSPSGNARCGPLCLGGRGRRARGTGVSPVRARSRKGPAARSGTGKTPAAPRRDGWLGSSEASPQDGSLASSEADGWLGSTGTDAKRWSASPQQSRHSPRRAWEAELPPRPLRLLARPVPLVAVSIMPEGPPLQFRWQGREHRVVHTWGPERIETGWWRGRRIRRDYYRVETTTGRRYWLFRSLDDGRWFLHGMFE